MMIKTSIFFCKSQHRLETTATQRSARAVPITAVEAGSSSGLTGHRVSSCSRSASRPQPTLRRRRRPRGVKRRGTGYSPRHPQAGMAALRDTGRGIFAPATARAEPHEPRRATRPRTRSFAERAPLLASLHVLPRLRGDVTALA